MAVTDETTYGRAALRFSDERDIDEFAEKLAQFESGALAPEEWRKYRLVRGTYGQRGPESMLRVKLPQGVANVEQLEALAVVAERFSRGFGHITTRQNVQFHFVQLSEVEAAQRVLAKAGLTMREACGNAVRNITACPFAGVSADEVFDVRPYGEATTRYFLRHKLAAVLPRKFKIAFEGCATDHAVTSINDVGLRARIQDVNGVPTRGFRVTVAGSTSIMCTTGYLLYDFLPASEVFEVIEAILLVYHRLGDYQHRQRNRLKFLIKAMTWDKWRAAYEAALLEVRAEGRKPMPFDPEHPPVEVAPEGQRPAAPTATEIASLVTATKTTGPGLHPTQIKLNVLSENYARWSETNVRKQKQPGFYAATVRLPLGDMTAGQMRAIGLIARAYGDGEVRVTPQQNLVMRWVPEIHLRKLWAAIQQAGLGGAEADTIADVLSCPGAESCRLAVTHSRSLGRVLTEFLSGRPDLVAAADGADIKISGCPNGCGQHHIATIGFQGSVRRLAGKAVPQYFVMVGGQVGAERADFGRVVAKIPVRRLTETVERLVVHYRDHHLDGERAADFFRRMSMEEAKRLLGDLEGITAADARDEDYRDLDQEGDFNPEVMDGECSA
ncbi:MAG: nitrite/sulfite reductase [Vicinamibacterales bacterium]